MKEDLKAGKKWGFAFFSWAACHVIVPLQSLTEENHTGHCILTEFHGIHVPPHVCYM